MKKSTSVPSPSSEVLAFARRLGDAMGDESLRAFAERCGLAHSTIRNYLNGKSTPDIETMELLSRKLGFDYAWLATGISPSRVEEERMELLHLEGVAAEALSNSIDSMLPVGHFFAQRAGVIGLSSEEFAVVPRMTAMAAAGDGVFVDGDHIEETMVLPRRWVRRVLGLPPEAIRVLQIHGDSMERTLMPGWLVLVDTTPIGLPGNGIYVIAVEDTLVVKRVLLDEVDRSLTLVSDNATYPPRKILANEARPRFVGRVAGVLSRIG